MTLFNLFGRPRGVLSALFCNLLGGKYQQSWSTYGARIENISSCGPGRPARTGERRSRIFAGQSENELRFEAAEYILQSRQSARAGRSLKT